MTGTDTDKFEIGRIIADYARIERLDTTKGEITLRLDIDNDQDLWELLHQMQKSPGPVFVDPRT